MSKGLLSPRGGAGALADLGERTPLVDGQRVGRARWRARRARVLARITRLATVVLVSLGGASAALAGARWVTTSPRFAVGDVEVHGASRVPVPRILAAAAIAPGATARRSSPSTCPSSSIQCRRAACTSVKGRRSSTRMVTRLGRSRTTSARRISGSAATRAATALPSSVHRFARGGIAAAARIRATGTREAPCTSTAATANRGDVVTHHPALSTAAATPSTSATVTTRRFRRASAAGGRARRRARR